MKALERKVLKEHIMNLAKEQFGDLLKAVQFSGPYEDEDLAAGIVLREKIPLNEIGAKLWNIHRPLKNQGYDVLIGHRFNERPKKKKTKQKAES